MALRRSLRLAGKPAESLPEAPPKPQTSTRAKRSKATTAKGSKPEGITKKPSTTAKKAAVMAKKASIATKEKSSPPEAKVLRSRTTGKKPAKASGSIPNTLPGWDRESFGTAWDMLRGSIRSLATVAVRDISDEPDFNQGSPIESMYLPSTKQPGRFYANKAMGRIWLLESFLWQQVLTTMQPRSIGGTDDEKAANFWRAYEPMSGLDSISLFTVEHKKWRSLGVRLFETLRGNCASPESAAQHVRNTIENRVKDTEGHFRCIQDGPRDSKSTIELATVPG
ncbi:hypothetical protein NLU13_4174 [Sarocladium strictum]|uniref:Uncharacterized protein n=1 Tax=Sarocladium strictum TaxID=5046 RepID=A0AA39GJ66_SARSR|nr:hypothetical protein NLU13_4174 [Sarocladium strictum]